MVILILFLAVVRHAGEVRCDDRYMSTVLHLNEPVTFERDCVKPIPVLSPVVSQSMSALQLLGAEIMPESNLGIDKVLTEHGTYSARNQLENCSGHVVLSKKPIPKKYSNENI